MARTADRRRRSRTARALTVNDGFRTWGHPGVPVADPPTDGAGIEVAVIDSPPIGDLVGAMLRDSDNGTAELLVKELGRRRGQGSTAVGTQVVREVLSGRGIPLQGVRIADGSGLSDVDRVTCRAITTLLEARVADLAGRLAVAGRNGTLARRFLDPPAVNRIRAKTGSLEGTAALAGYVDTTSGATLAFAYVVTGLAHDASARALQDALATALVTIAP